MPLPKAPAFGGGERPEGIGAAVRSAVLAGIFALDRHLQRRGGIFNYTSDPGCVFRISLLELNEPVALANGVTLPKGAAIAELHLWNEQVPVMSPGTSPMAYGLRMGRAMAHSLHLLARYLGERDTLGRVRAVRADMAFGTAEETAHLLRLCGRYGFVCGRDGPRPKRSALHRFGENVLIAMLVFTRNPSALRLAMLRRDRVRVFLTREELDRRFLRAATRHNREVV